MKIILIVGLPGSGKSYLANLLAKDDENSVIIDDISDTAQLPKLANLLIITDVNFCQDSVRDLAIHILNKIYPHVSIEWVFFENNSAACRLNVAHRNDGRYVEGTIRRFENEYHIPRGYSPVGIWQPGYMARPLLRHF